eukprot:3303065-Heterocapsa_arctica.AAC.1
MTLDDMRKDAPGVQETPIIKNHKKCKLNSANKVCDTNSQSSGNLRVLFAKQVAKRNEGHDPLAGTSHISPE